MRMYGHKLQLNGEPFTIASYDYACPPEKISECSPIIVHVRECNDAQREPRDLSEAIQLDVADGDFARLFRRHCQEILEGAYQDFKLVCVQIYANRMVLEIFNTTDKTVKTAILDVTASSVTSLDLQLEVPSSNGMRRRAGYEITVQHRRAMVGYSPYVTTIIKEQVEDSRYTLFKLCSTASHEMIVSECVR